MKIFKSTIFLLILLVVALASTHDLFGQESGSPGFESYDSEAANGIEKVVTVRESSEPVKSSLKPATHPVLQLDNTDSVVVRFQTNPVKSAPKSPNKPKDDDDSVLSFNFLYYLIERYKLQDIMD
jgi:hypothetical protein